MGTLTLAELKDEVKRGLGNRSDTDSRLTRFLNLAQERLSRINDFEELRSITSGNLSVTTDIAADKLMTLVRMRELYSFRILDGADSRKLRQVSPRQWDSVIPEPEYFSRNTPTHYTIWQSQTVELWPIPDQPLPYVLRWTRWPVAFSDTLPNAVSDFESKDELLITLAMAYCFGSLSKTSDADRCYGLAKTLLLEAINMESRRPDLEHAPASEIFKSSSMGGSYWLDPFTSDAP